jgi:hypothetical protein
MAPPTARLVRRDPHQNAGGTAVTSPYRVRFARRGLVLVVALAVALPFAACKKKEAAPSQPPGVTETPLADTPNPPGSIPATQAYTSYKSPSGGFAVDLPDGWARSENGAQVTVLDGYDGIGCGLLEIPGGAPTVESVRQTQVPQLEQNGHAVRVESVESVTLPGGPAVLIRFTSNSDPQAQSGQRIRLANEMYLVYQGGRVAALNLWAPKGSDHAAGWQRVVNSFRWS